MNRSFYIPGLFSLVFIIWSCSPYRYIDIQVLKPAEVAWDHNIDTLFLLETIRINANDTNSETRLLNLHFLYNFNKILAKQLKESPIFVHTNIMTLPYNYVFNSYRNSNFEERKHIYACSVSSIEIKDTTYNAIIISREGVCNQVTYHIIYRAKFRFTNFINMSKEITIEDTVWWDSGLIYSSPSNVKVKTEAYIELGKIAAENMAKKIAPYWITDERVIFYASNKIMRKGYKSFSENTLDAINYWREIYDSGTKRLAAMASYNIALSYETMDSLNLSKYWLDNSVLLKKNKQALKYQGLIKNRIKEKEKLDEQFKMDFKQIN